MHYLAMFEFIDETRTMQINSHSLRNARDPFDDPEPKTPLPVRFFAGLMLALIAIAFAGVAVGQAPASLTPGNDVDATVARRNRLWLESKTGEIQLPPGTIVFDVAFSPNPGSIINGNGSRLVQKFTAAPFRSNCTIQGVGSGLGHVDDLTHLGKAQIQTAAAPQCPPGTLVYVWQHNNSATTPIRQRRIVSARNGNALTLDSPIDPRCNKLKWLADAVPIDDVTEGAVTLPVLRPNLPIGCTVLVTDGPSVADEAAGEIRTVAAATGNSVTLNRPLRRSYTLPSIARVATIDNVTIRNCIIDLPVNTASECLFLTLARGWKLERCAIRKFACGNCADVQFTDCDLGWAQVTASSHDVQFRGCRIESVNFEEATHDCTIDACRLGPVSANMNCVTLNAKAERLTVRNSHLLGGLQPSSQILMFGPARECLFENLTLTGRSPCWLKGSMRWANVHTDGDVHVQ